MITPDSTYEWRRSGEHVTAYSCLAARLQGNGSIINGPSKEALYALLGHMVELLAGRSPSAAPSYFLASLDPGQGKTTAVCSLLKTWRDLGFRPGGSVLVGLSRLEEIRAYVDASGLGASDFAVLTGDKGHNDLGLQDASQARVLFTTQAQLLLRKHDGKAFAAMSDFHFQGRARSLRIWDESLIPAEPVIVELDHIHGMVGPIRALSDPGASMLCEMLADAQAGTTGRLAVPTALIEQRGVCKLLSDPQQQERWKHLLTIANSPAGALVHRRNQGGPQLIGGGQRLPADFAPAVILDASGRVRETYRVMERHGGNLVRLPEIANDYARLTIHHWDRAASRSALKDTDGRQGILQVVADLINAHDDQPEEWLIVHHKARAELDVRKDLEAMVDNADTRLSFIHWGDHHGTNRYRHIRNVVVLGLWNLPGAAYAAQHLAAHPRGHEELPVITREDLAAMAAGEHRHNLLQAICRANVRNSSDGGCGDCTAYVVGKVASGLLEETFPGADVKAWEPVEPELTGQARKVANEIERCFSDPSVFQVRKADIREAAGLPNAPRMAEVVRRSDFQRWLGRKGLEVKTRAFERLEAA